MPIGSLDGFRLTWYYYGYCNWYPIVIAVTQIISSLLLFFRKTTRIGIILFLTFMINILLTDFAYDINAKGIAITLTLMAFFVLFSDYEVFIKYFLEEPPLYQNSDRPKWINKISAIKFIYIPAVFIGFFIMFSILKTKYMSQDNFYGTWENLQTKERLHFENLNNFQMNKTDRLESIVNGEYSFTKDSLTLKSNDNSQNKTKNYLKGKYIIHQSDLTITTKTDNLKFRRIR
ncbi:hypothetical protein DM790_12880 [Flavobacterium collinsii]|nr:hypothetical protein [Flavobacterium collinsii]